GEAVFAMDHHEMGLRQPAYLTEHFARAHSFPQVIQLAPARDAVHVRVDAHAWQGQEFVIATLPGRLHEAEDVKGPRGPIEVWRTTSVQHRPFARQCLPRRDAFRSLDIGADNLRDVIHRERKLRLVVEATLANMDHGMALTEYPATEYLTKK